MRRDDAFNAERIALKDIFYELSAEGYELFAPIALSCPDADGIAHRLLPALYCIGFFAQGLDPVLLKNLLGLFQVVHTEDYDCLAANPS